MENQENHEKQDSWVEVMLRGFLRSLVKEQTPEVPDHPQEPDAPRESGVAS